jgi:hypothetical protein
MKLFIFKANVSIKFHNVTLVTTKNVRFKRNIRSTEKWKRILRSLKHKSQKILFPNETVSQKGTFLNIEYISMETSSCLDFGSID